MAVVVARRRDERNIFRCAKAGVKQIVTKEQLDFLHLLANQLGWTTGSIEKFCKRQIKKAAPTTTEDANKVIEGMKAILSRRPN